MQPDLTPALDVRPRPGQVCLGQTSWKVCVRPQASLPRVPCWRQRVPGRAEGEGQAQALWALPQPNHLQERPRNPQMWCEGAEKATGPLLLEKRLTPEAEGEAKRERHTFRHRSTGFADSLSRACVPGLEAAARRQGGPRRHHWVVISEPGYGLGRREVPMRGAPGTALAGSPAEPRDLGPASPWVSARGSPGPHDGVGGGDMLSEGGNQAGRTRPQLQAVHSPVLGTNTCSFPLLLEPTPSFFLTSTSWLT